MTSGALPPDVVIESVAAGTDIGWIVGTDGSTQQLWAQGDDGDAQMLASLPELRSLTIEPIGSNIAIAGYTCKNADDALCADPRVDVSIVSPNGTVEETVTVASREEPLGDGDGLSLIGGGESGLWLSSGLGLHRVAADGSVEAIEWVDGELCAIDGTLYSARMAGAATGLDNSAPTQPPTVTPSDAAELEIEIVALTDGGWRKVVGAERPADGTHSVTVRCDEDGFAITEIGTAQLISYWTPQSAWNDGGRSLVPADGEPVAPQQPGKYVQQPDGAILIRGVDGAYQRADLSLPRSGRAVSIPTVVVIDQSESTLIGCASRVIDASTGDESSSMDEAVVAQTTTTCDVAPST